MTQDLAGNYANVYNNKIGFGKKPALILIDFVEAYFDESCALYADVEKELESAIRIRDKARGAGIPVIYTNVEFNKTGLNGGVFFKKVKPLENFIQGSAMGAWPKSLNPSEDELVITKQYPSAFFGTSLSSTLAAAGIDSLIITGLTTSGCVRATCIDSCSYGFIPIVVSDACGDRHEDPHKANLFDMNAKYADVVNESEILEYLSTLKSV